MGKILVDGEVEIERTAFIHALVRLDGQGKIENIVRIGEGGFHRFAKGAFELCEVWEPS